MARLIRSVLVASVLLVMASPGFALDADTPFGVSGPAILELPSGGQGSLELTYGVLDENWFLYRDMSSVTLNTEGSPLQVGDAVFSEGEGQVR